MGLTKDQTTTLIVLGVVFVTIVVFFLTYKPKAVEGFTSSSIVSDAENPNLTNDQVYGLIPAAASASIFRKKDARDKAANLDNLAYDKAEGKFLIQTSNVELLSDPNDIQNILIRLHSKEGFATVQELAAQTAKDELTAKVKEKSQEKLLNSKAGQKIADKVVKTIVKVNAKISTKLGNRLGAGVAKKLAEKASIKIAELIGRRAAVATALGATQTAIPDPSGITKFFGVVLTLFGAVGLTAQFVVASVLKGEDGFCPKGYERLNGAIPSFLTKVPGIGDILDVMGAYVCFRNACDPNEDEDAGLCYDKCDKGYNGIGPVCWANKNDVGVGQLKVCPPGWTNDGLTCREPINTSIDPCPAGSNDVAGTCWGKERTCVGGCGGDCGTWRCCGCSWSYNRDVVTRSLGQRNMRTTGGRVKGRAAGSDLPCPGTHPNEVDGLCYRTCPSDTPNRVKGMPYLCSRASRVGDGRPDGTSYGRGVGRPKLKLKPVEKDPAPQPAPPPPNSSASFADDPNTTCRADFSSVAIMRDMCKFYFDSAKQTPNVVKNVGIEITYISRISRVVASSEQSCDVLCDLTKVTLANATSKTPISQTTVKDKSRRFYFARIPKGCLFIVTGATNTDDTGKELTFPDAAPISVNFAYNPFV